MNVFNTTELLDFIELSTKSWENKSGDENKRNYLLGKGYDVPDEYEGHSNPWKVGRNKFWAISEVDAIFSITSVNALNSLQIIDLLATITQKQFNRLHAINSFAKKYNVSAGSINKIIDDFINAGYIKYLYKEEDMYKTPDERFEQFLEYKNAKKNGSKERKDPRWKVFVRHDSITNDDTFVLIDEYIKYQTFGNTHCWPTDYHITPYPIIKIAFHDEIDEIEVRLRERWNVLKPYYETKEENETVPLIWKIAE